MVLRMDNLLLKGVRPEYFLFNRNFLLNKVFYENSHFVSLLRVTLSNFIVE